MGLLPTFVRWRITPALLAGHRSSNSYPQRVTTLKHVVINLQLSYVPLTRIMPRVNGD
jgi:hypothetical protein